MNQRLAELSVADVLQRWPETVPVFFQRRMACVGCAMAPFETLETAAAIYYLDIPSFLADLEAAISHRNDSQKPVFWSSPEQNCQSKSSSE
jgi:hybrid cluster-associated redox disulfide protein